MILLVVNIAFAALAAFFLVRYWDLLTWLPKSLLIVGGSMQAVAVTLRLTGAA